MDMRQHLRKLLTNDFLLTCNDHRYVGVIRRVVEESVYNRFKRDHAVEPMIYFDDGLMWVPNITARRFLVEVLGADTDAWTGKRIAVFLTRSTRIQKFSRQTVESTEKRVELLGDGWEDEKIPF